MGDQLLSQIQDIMEGPIDFGGQRKVEYLTNGVLIGTGIIAFIVGYIQENIYYTLWTGLFGTLMTFIIVVPPWPSWNEDPEPWLPSTKKGGAMNILVDGKKVN